MTPPDSFEIIISFRNLQNQNRTELANEAAAKATEAKKFGDLMAALECHSRAAKLYRDNAMEIRDQNCKYSLGTYPDAQLLPKQVLTSSHVHIGQYLWQIHSYF